MLVIRDAQMQVLREQGSRRSVDRLAQALRGTCPAESATLTDDELRREVTEGVAHAEAYGLESEDDLMPFLECRLAYGPAFEDRPELAWMGAVLRDKGLFPGEKADLLADRDLVLRVQRR